MTKDRDFKRAVRSRMAQTGEPYMTARRALVAEREEASVVGCPTPCAEDCGASCHEVHAASWERDHAVGECLRGKCRRCDVERMLTKDGVMPNHKLAGSEEYCLGSRDLPRM